MRDAISLQGQNITYDNDKYEIKNFYIVPKTSNIYVKLQRLSDNIYLNVSLTSILYILQQQIKI
jgi:hypothetical protein